MIGFGVKVAMVPMHTWLPDAHSQAPSGISAMLSGVVIEAGLVALLRALAALAGVTASWGELLMAFGALNMLVGNLMALRQTQVKRLLAYSSLSHVGYMLVGLGIALYAHRRDRRAGQPVPHAESRPDEGTGLPRGGSAAVCAACRQRAATGR